MTTPFTHLHLHTQYSLLDGAIKQAPLFERTKALGQQAIAMTDHGNLFGAIEFYEKARASGVKPILGCETYIAAGSRHEKERREHDTSGFDAISHQLLLAMNETGYRNLRILVSKAYLDGFYYKPRIDLELLKAHSEGLITTSGCLSSLVCRKLLGGESRAAWELVEELSRVFEGRYYLELQRHGIKEQELVNAELFKMSEEMGLPLLATNDAHYLEKCDHEDHDALLCIGTGSSLQDERRFRFNGSGFFVKSGDEMLELFHDCPQALKASMEIAERCELEIPMHEYHMPEFQTPGGESKDAVLQREAWRGLREKLGMEADAPFQNGHAAYEARMQYELNVIQEMGYASYFLIVADFIQYARKNRIPVGPGRGSSAGSLAAFGLGITTVDPIEYDILFERFLNPERVSMPDIDVDFCMHGRDEVIKYVIEKYDDPEAEDIERRVAQIITFGTLQARAALRDVGRVMGLAYGEVDRIAKMVPETLGTTLEDARSRNPEFRRSVEGDERVGRLYRTALKLEGLTRHASTHAAGIVIGAEPLIERVPLYRDNKTGDVLTQYDKDCVEKVGLIKFDFLGLRTLTIIEQAEVHIRKLEGQANFSAAQAPLDDGPAYDLLCAGDTEGVFQMESSGITDLVTKLAPRSIKEVIPLIALYRPGPLESKMVDDYVARKSGRAQRSYPAPECEDILEETFGVIVYQDQVMQIANQLAGYSLGEADMLRSAMSKKKAEEMAKHEDRFVNGCAGRGMQKGKAKRLYQQIAKFAEYAFPKAHATAYALITYQTAYLKANYPREFLAALLSVEAGNKDKVARTTAHARERGIQVFAPDVNESIRDFAPTSEGIRFGLAGVRHVGEGAIEVILKAREAGGPFKDLFDFACRVDPRRVNKRVIEALVKCGAFDSLHKDRAALCEALEELISAAAAAQRDQEVGQESLFGEMPATPAMRLDAAREPWSDATRLEFEKEVLGFYITGHPLEARRRALAQQATVTGSGAGAASGQQVCAGGMVTQYRETQSRRGGTMAFAVLEDLEGSFELVIFSSVYEAHGELLSRIKNAEPGLVLLVRGEWEESDSNKPCKILVRELEELVDTMPVHIHLRVSEWNRRRGQDVARLLEAHPGPQPVFVHLEIPGESETVLELPPERRVNAGAVLHSKLAELFGRGVIQASP